MPIVPQRPERRGRKKVVLSRYKSEPVQAEC